MEDLYYFDALPIRLQPAYLESCTSFLTRLAERNHISSVDALTAICFPLQDRRITRELADYPPGSLEALARAAGCSKATLLGTTFFHLGTKFGRSSKSQALSRFLNGSIVSYLRFCPLCLVDQKYPHYSLLWRFPSIRCCITHCCMLLDRCEHCKSRIPFLAAPLKIGKCSFCGSELKTCHTNQSSEEDFLSACLRHQELEFFLSPLSGEMNIGNVAQLVGQQLKYRRKSHDLTALELSNSIGTTLTVVEGIERGNILTRGARFQNYVRYAEHLDVLLKDIFVKVLDRRSEICPDTDMASNLPICPLCHQRNLVSKFGHNHSGSQRYRCQRCNKYFTPRISTRSIVTNKDKVAIHDNG